MLQLEPQEQFTIARGLEDWTDSTQYYVQAVIRNAYTDAVIDTVNLTDRGDHHRYSKPWWVPADQTGLGFYILIETSVYSDSGYSSKASNYADKYDTYLVQRRMNPNLMGSGGDNLDYKLVRKIIKEELAAIPKEAPEPTEAPEPPNIAFHIQPLLNAIADLRNDVQDVDLPEPDFSGVEFRLSAIEKAVNAIKLPETDLSPVLEAISALQQALEPHSEQMKADSGQLLDRVKQFFQTDMDEIKTLVGSLESKLNSVAYLVLSQAPQPKQKEAKPDYSQLLP